MKRSAAVIARIGFNVLRSYLPILAAIALLP
jgi:hypothetical protein